MADNRPKIKELGKARYIEFFKNRKQVKNSKSRGEIFFSITKKAKKGYGNSVYGYMKINSEMQDFIKSLIQERSENMHVEVIEWDDSYNVVFEDGMYISSKMCRMEKPDFEAWESTISPA